jgi:hypothetical protein
MTAAAFGRPDDFPGGWLPLPSGILPSRFFISRVPATSFNPLFRVGNGRKSGSEIRENHCALAGIETFRGHAWPSGYRRVKAMLAMGCWSWSWLLWLLLGSAQVAVRIQRFESLKYVLRSLHGVLG